MVRANTLNKGTNRESSVRLAPSLTETSLHHTRAADRRYHLPSRRGLSPVSRGAPRTMSAVETQGGVQAQNGVRRTALRRFSS